MYKNYKIWLFFGAAVIFLYLSVGKYEEFSIKKSISACVLAKSKIKNPQKLHIVDSKTILPNLRKDPKQGKLT